MIPPAFFYVAVGLLICLFFFFQNTSSNSALREDSQEACACEMLSEELSLAWGASKEGTCIGGPGSQKEGKGVQ